MSNVHYIELLLSDLCFEHDQLYVTFSRCDHTPDDQTKTELKLIVYNTYIQGRRKDHGDIHTNEIEGITTQNIVVIKIF